MRYCTSLEKALNRALGAALTAVAGAQLRYALAALRIAPAALELAVRVPVVAASETKGGPVKGGRRKTAKREVLTTVSLSGDFTLHAASNRAGFRFGGRAGA